MSKAQTPPRRATQGEVEQRTSEIFNQIVLGYSRRDILPIYTERWNLSESQIDKYIRSANARLVEIAHADRAAMWGLSIERLNSMFRDAIAAGEKRLALDCLREIHSISNFRSERITLEISWQERCIADIRRGIIPYAMLAEAFSEQLAAELFRRANRPIPDDDSWLLDDGNGDDE